LTKRLDRSMLETEVVEIFKAAIKSPVTRDVYERRLLNFLKYMKMTPGEFVSLAKNDPLGAEKKIIAFAFELKKRFERAEIAAGTVHNCVKCVRLLLEMNDMSLNWKKISRILPKPRKYALDRVPTPEEIIEILDASDVRGRPLSLLLVSSGIREGAVETLCFGDYAPIRNNGQIIAGRLVVYAGHPEQYVAFITFEACAALDKYLEFRRENGENITNTSPLFRDTFDPIASSDDKEKIVSNMTAHSIRQYYNRLLHPIGIRKDKRRRHEFSVHGFRKYFKTKAEQSGMKPINVEILMGHSVGISGSYYRPTENDLLQGYLKAVDALTISEEKQLRHEVEKLKVENAEIDIMKKCYLDMKLVVEKEYKNENDRMRVLATMSGLQKGDTLCWYETLSEPSNTMKSTFSIKPENLNLEKYKRILLSKLNEILEITGQL
jgi:integrase